MSHSLIHPPPAHHSHPSSHIHCFIPGSKLTFSTNLFHRSLLAPTWTAISDYNGPDLLGSTVFHFYFLYIFFYFWSCGKLSWLNCQLSSARQCSIFTYLLTLTSCQICAVAFLLKGWWLDSGQGLCGWARIPVGTVKDIIYSRLDCSWPVNRGE